VAPAAVPLPAAASRAVAPEDTDAELDKRLGLSSKGEEGGEAPTSLGLQLVQTLVTLSLVLGLVYLVLNVGLRKLMPPRGRWWRWWRGCRWSRGGRCTC